MNLMPFSTESRIPGISLTSIVPKPEPEFLTEVPVFLGLATPHSSKNSQEYEPRKIVLNLQFEEYFKSSDSYLREAIEGFFQNGGRLCYAIALPENTLECLQKGLETSEILEDVDLVCAPDIMFETEEKKAIEMQLAVLDHCERVGDRFAILDAYSEREDLPYQREQLEKHRSSLNGALYAPWVKVENPSMPDNMKTIPPCGHIAGVYARTARAIGIHGAPANTPIEGILDVGYTLTRDKQANLNEEDKSGVNYIRSFPGRGIRAWGARTLSPSKDWKYISTRRLFLTFRRWIDWNLNDAVFEPNTFQLWTRLQRELSVYCESLWRQGALQGSVPQEAFYVKCDAGTNPSANRETGKVIAEIGLAPSVPGEFIHLLLVQNSSGIAIV